MPEEKEDFTVFEELKLDEKNKEKLRQIKNVMPSARVNLAKLKKVGVDVRVLEEHLDWAEEVAKTLIEDFT